MDPNDSRRFRNLEPVLKVFRVGGVVFAAYAALSLIVLVLVALDVI